MKFFNNAVDKFKNLFIEEQVVTEKEEIKKDVIKVEIPSPEERKPEPIRVTEPVTPKIEVQEEPIKNVEVPNIEPHREIKKNNSLFFSDDDFDTLEKPKTREKLREEVKKQSPVKEQKNLYNGSKKVEMEVPKTFKPTPIISPVYGILDKNYNKDDIVPKKEKSSFTSYTTKEDKISIESIRNKAFGALADDCIKEVEPEIIKNDDLLEDDIFNDLDLHDTKESDDDLSITNILDSFDDNFVDTVDSPIEDKLSRSYDEETGDFDDCLDKNESVVEEKVEETNDDVYTDDDDFDLEENDLFNLIDSMYEKGDDE